MQRIGLQLYIWTGKERDKKTRISGRQKKDLDQSNFITGGNAMQTEIKLISLKLKNFKGIRDFELILNGESLSIYGDNGTGKTTINDAFTWLISDKDSQGKKDFGIKTLDANNNPLTGLDHEVEGVMSVNGKILKLRKVYAEVWTKKRGSIDPEFTGHTTDYYIDDVPVKAKEYNEKIAEIIGSEEIFKLLSNPLFFNDDKQFPWQKRRAILMELDDNKITPEDVIASNPKLSELTTVLQGRSPEDYKKILKARSSEVNNKIETIPVRVDEANRSIPKMPDQTKAEIEAEISRLNTAVAKCTEELNVIKNGGALALKRTELSEIEADLSKMRTEHQIKIDKIRAEVLFQKNEYRSKILDLNGEITGIQRTIDDIKRQQSAIQKERDAKREKWYEVNEREFQLSLEEVCPACGQAIPTEKLEAVRQAALEQFNLAKAEELEKLVAEGLQLKAEMEENEKRIESEETRIRALTKQMTALEWERDNIVEPKAPEPDPEIEKLTLKAAQIKAEIADIEAASAQIIGEKEGELYSLSMKVQELAAELLKFEQKDRAEARIAELKNQERELAKEYERIEQELFLLEEFTRTKVDLVTDKINAKFKMARFKLFEQQINGGIADCCETLYNGVPFSSGLNHGAQINVGLDIINTLSDHYKFTVPIFVDNAEAVTQLIETRGQTIRLVVSEPDKTLRWFEYPEELKKGAV